MLIILDRDGVINEDSKFYIKAPEEWSPIKGSLKAIAKLNKAGHHVVIITNQSGIGRGFYSEEDLQQIHAKMHHALAEVGGHIDEIFYCPHSPDDHCFCRKPEPGLMWEIAEYFQTDFKDALLIGDSERDILCAKAVNCKAVLVKTGNGAKVYSKKPDLNVPVFKDLAAVVTAILQGEIK